MTDSLKKVPLVTAALLALLATPALAEPRALPASTFACQVQTESGIAGLIAIQADDMQAAKKLVINESAKTLAGNYSITRSVVECVVVPEGRFRDSHFQSFYQQMLK